MAHSHHQHDSESNDSIVELISTAARLAREDIEAGNLARAEQHLAILRGLRKLLAQRLVPGPGSPPSRRFRRFGRRFGDNTNPNPED